MCIQDQISTWLYFSLLVVVKLHENLKEEQQVGTGTMLRQGWYRFWDGWGSFKFHGGL